MTPETPYDGPKGLPPVAPPSGRFIAQLFLVPGLIVAVAVGILWGFSWIVGGGRTAEQYLNSLRSPNAQVQWRAANDLAQILPRDPALASDPRLALDLADLLGEALGKRPRNAESPAAGRPAGIGLSDADAERGFVLVLMNSLGHCRMPAGVPVLKAVAAQRDGPEAEPRRQGAVWALANLGEAINQLAGLGPAERERILGVLEEECASPDVDRARAARLCRDYLRDLPATGPRALGVDETLADCARADDPFLRKLSALALNVWRGSAAENDRMESTLLALTYDNGHGATDDANLRGLEIRYTAVQGLARRGSAKIRDRLAVLAEMLDEQRQRQNFRRPDQPRVQIDEQAVMATLRGGLRAAAELHRQKPELDLSALEDAVEKLTHSTSPAVRAETEKVRLAWTKG